MHSANNRKQNDGAIDEQKERQTHCLHYELSEFGEADVALRGQPLQVRRVGRRPRNQKPEVQQIHGCEEVGGGASIHPNGHSDTEPAEGTLVAV
jgi:hypothetical protein